LAGDFPSPTYAQSPANNLKPTFISPTPGLYVNGWPPFTVSYPKEWVEIARGVSAVFRVGTPREDLFSSPQLSIDVSPIQAPTLEEWAKSYISFWANIFTDIRVLSDKPSQLKDGTPAREVQVEYVPKYNTVMAAVKNAPKHHGLLLLTKEGVSVFASALAEEWGKTEENLKKAAYSLTFLPSGDEPVKVPPDVKAFLDMDCVDLVSHDVKAILSHYSDRFLHSGANKAFMERWFRDYPLSPLNTGIVSEEVTVTIFEAHGDRAYIDGFFLLTKKGDAKPVKGAMYFQQIINENGQWKWFGNQK